MLSSQIIDNGFHESQNMVGGLHNVEKPHSLKGTVLRYLNKELAENKLELQRSFIGMNPFQKASQEQIEYAIGDVEYLIPLYHEQQKYIKQRDLDKIVQLENKLTPVLVKMEFRGCAIDKDKHKKNINNWKHTINNIESQLDEEIINLAKSYPKIQGGKFTNVRRKEEVVQLDVFGGEGYVVKNLNLYNVNYSSPKQIEDLFDRVNAPKPCDDDGKISFGENAIKTYVNNNPDSVMNNFVKLLLEYREYDKLLGTYGAKLLRVLDRDDRLRTNYGQCWTDTGRLNSSEVIKGELGANLANIPKRKDIRAIIVPDPGYSFIDSDLTGQEVLLAGDFSKEPVLLKAFKEGFDHHSFLASISYSIIFDRKVTIVNEDKEFEIDGFRYNYKKLRDVHKSCLFAKFYGGGKMRVMNVLNEYLVNHWQPADRLLKADEISKALNAALPKLTKFLKSKVDEAKKTGYTIANKLGRRRYYDNVDSTYGEIMNMPKLYGQDKSDKLLENLSNIFGEVMNFSYII